MLPTLLHPFHGAKRALIDCVGVMLAGSKEEVARIAMIAINRF